MTGRIGVHIAPKWGTKPIRYVTLHLRDRRGATSLRHRNHAATTVLVCEQKPHPVWFSWRRISQNAEAIRDRVNMALVREDFLAGVGMKNCQRLVLESLRRRQQERQESNRYRQTKQQLCTCITVFCTLLCRRCTSTTLNCLISRFFEDRTKRKQLSFSFPGLWCSPLESNFKNVCQHLTN